MIKKNKDGSITVTMTKLKVLLPLKKPLISEDEQKAFQKAFQEELIKQFLADKKIEKIKENK